MKTKVMGRQELVHHLKDIGGMTDTGTFEGALAVYNNVDLGGDSIEPGAFTKSIQDHGSSVKLLYQHYSDRPIGMLQLTDTPKALMVKGEIDLEMKWGGEAYRAIKKGFVDGLSIGFDTIKYDDTGGVRKLKELRLWEGSIVTFPMNMSCTITSVKALKEMKGDFNTEFADIKLQEQFYQTTTALRYALSSIVYGEGTSDEKVAASLLSIQQFQQTYMEYIPAYLAWYENEYNDMMSYYASKGPSELKDAEARERERKEGRKISADSKKTISSARTHMKSADDILCALCDDEAGDEGIDDELDENGLSKSKPSATSKDKAAPTPNPEPATIDHSAAETQTLLDSIRSLIRAA